MIDKRDLRPPTGFHTFTWDWIKAFNGVPKIYKELYPDETVELLKPKGLDSPRWDNMCRFRNSFVTIIPNGRLWGLNANVITPDDKLLWDVSIEHGSKPTEHSVFRQKQLPPVTYTAGTVATIAKCGHNNYFHWFLEVLPRIHLLKMSGIPIDKYILNGDLRQPDIQYETLAQLGITRDQIILTHENLHIKAKRLAVPSVPGVSGFPKWSCDYLREAFLEKNKSVKKLNDFERIYISRDDAASRKVLNEKEVMGVLEKYGFKKVLLRSVPLIDKINIFNSAKFIVSPISAGLTNLVFCNPGTKVIEFSSKNYVFDGYWKISNYVNLDYYYMVCEGGNPPINPPNWDNIVVDTEKLSKILKMAGIEDM